MKYVAGSERIDRDDMRCDCALFAPLFEPKQALGAEGHADHAAHQCLRTAQARAGSPAPLANASPAVEKIA